MWMLLIALLLTVLKYFEVGPLAGWSWWWLLVPYGLTAAWWGFADATGLTKRRVGDQQEARRLQRIARQKQALGTRRPPR
ncbi:TIGR04438 family Trp-rich protein [Pantoea sp. 18069]|uniref:TIGR04438 family Trp-rich protein n=1 Tax=Pantoea sp. 18069 TaxID=2681415 RepID=UPI00135B871A|nr:TIGR04438 family Trp-rich protein [Pantoea sp. 18069]